jgi:stress response protein YsnF
VTLRFADGREVTLPAEVSDAAGGRGPCVRVDVPEEIAQAAPAESALSVTSTHAPTRATPDEAAAPGQITVPVVEESIEVGTRWVETARVRVRLRVDEREEIVDLPLETEELDVQRVPVGREVPGPIPARQEGGATVFSVVEEVIRVEKRWWLREEIRVGLKRFTRHDPRAVRVGRQEAVVERLPTDPLDGSETH